MNEYDTEKFIEQYEHIKQLELLTNEELSCLKKKRAHFEVSIKSATDIKPFCDYIKYEVALMKKFKQMEYNDVNEALALERALCSQILNIHRYGLKRFPQNRQFWKFYIEFAKLKFKNKVSSIYKEMLAFHNTKDDYMEAIKHEMDVKNYFVAINLIVQAMSKEKESKEFVVVHIECSLLQAQDDEHIQERTLIQVRKLYNKFLKGSKDINLYVKLLNKIQNLKFSMDFQNEIIAYLITVFHERPVFWNLMASRHLDGLFYECKNESEDIPYEKRIRHALSIYTKSLQFINDTNREEMYDFYFTKLVELDALPNVNEHQHAYIKQAFQEILNEAYEENSLPEKYYIMYMKLRFTQKFKDLAELNHLITKGCSLYPKSMDFIEIAIKYYYSVSNYDEVSNVFRQSVENNPEQAVNLYKFLCSIYSATSQNKDMAIRTMMEAIENNKNSKLSAVFQAYILKYYATTEGIKKARETYTKILNSSNVVSLSLNFFMEMIEIERFQFEKNHKIIKDCFERATMMFGKTSPDLWLEYIKYNWEHKNYSEAAGIRNRAIETMKEDLQKVNDFQLKYTLFANETE